jgi:ParB-like chromosome segregation protein Spo0J
MGKISQKSPLARSIDKTGAQIAVIYRAVSELKLDPGNPRVHSPRQIRQIARSIEAFGFITPILVDIDSQVIAGHGRVLAARQLGLELVPTIRLEHLTDEQVKAFKIADNRLTENSTWNIGCWPSNLTNCLSST